MINIGKFIKCGRASIATEFALMAPIMILIWVGVVELATLHLVARKVEVAAQTAADIIAQDETASLARLDDMEQAVNAILAPYPVTSVGYAFTSITEDGANNNAIGWHSARGALDGTPPPDPAIANDLNNGNDSAIVVRITYLHTPVVFSAAKFAWLSASTMLDETVFARPRRVRIIPCDDCP